MRALDVENLTVRLAGRPVLHQVGFGVDRGTWLGVLGPNGSGKTTLLRAIGGLLPFDGSIRLDGRPLDEWSDRDRARRLAFVRQSLGIAFDFSVQDVVLLGRAPHKGWLTPFDRNDRRLVRDALHHVDLEGFEDRSMFALSGGEQRRVLLAQALVQQADLLLLDEPTTHLDVHHQFEFLDHVRRLVDGGATAIGVFHDLELAARYTDRVLVLDDGRVRADGPAREVLSTELIARVFLMEVESRGAGDSDLGLRYRAPIPRPERNGGSPEA
jgi:iron complex transport system ATP-binding protein